MGTAARGLTSPQIGRKAVSHGPQYLSDRS
jgi:hypothetical protein